MMHASIYGMSPIWFRKGLDQMMRRCIAEKEETYVFESSHASPFGEHHGGNIKACKVLQSDFFGLPYSNMLLFFQML